MKMHNKRTYYNILTYNCLITGYKGIPNEQAERMGGATWVLHQKWSTTTGDGAYLSFSSLGGAKLGGTTFYFNLTISCKILFINVHIKF